MVQFKGESILTSASHAAVQRPSEQADDSEAFYVLTQRGAEMAKRLAVGKVAVAQSCSAVHGDRVLPSANRRDYLMQSHTDCSHFVPLQGRTAHDFIRHLKAAFVEALDAQQEGAIDPTAFDWKRLGR